MSKTRPDAVVVPRSQVTGSDDNARKESVVEVAELLLECGPQELAWCHDQMSYFFCTRKPEDTELYPSSHPHIGKPRYRWEVRDEGVKLGYLLSEGE